jgi:hypothetical protein
MTVVQAAPSATGLAQPDPCARGGRSSSSREALGRRPASGFPSAGRRPSEEELDLAVDGAQVVGRPSLQRRQRLRIQPQQEGLALGHQVGRTMTPGGGGRRSMAATYE